MKPKRPNVKKFDHRDVSNAELHEMACAYAEEEHFAKGEVMPVWLINVPGHIIWMESDWRSEDEKYAHATMVGALCDLLQAKAYTLISEVYAASYTARPDGTVPDINVRPADRPKNERDELLMISTTARHGPGIMTRYLITPRRIGQPLLGPRVDEEWTGVGGFMNDLFRIGRKAAEKSNAEELIAEFMKMRH